MDGTITVTPNAGDDRAQLMDGEHAWKALLLLLAGENVLDQIEAAGGEGG